MSRFISKHETVPDDLMPGTYLVLNSVRFHQFKDGILEVPQEFSSFTFIEAGDIPQGATHE